jgi:hypothetical protein
MRFIGPIPLGDKLLVDAELKKCGAVRLTERQVETNHVDEGNDQPQADSAAAANVNTTTSGMS